MCSLVLKVNRYVVRNYTKLLASGHTSAGFRNLIDFSLAKSRIVPKGVDIHTFLDNEYHKCGFTLDSIKNCQNHFHDVVEKFPRLAEKINNNAQFLKSGGCISKSQIPTSSSLYSDVIELKRFAQARENGVFRHILNNDKLASIYELEYAKCSDAVVNLKMALNRKLECFFYLEYGKVINVVDGSSLNLILEDLINKLAVNTHTCFVIEKNGFFYFFTMTSNKKGQVQLLFRGSNGIDQYVCTDAIVVPTDCVILGNVALDPTQNLFSSYNIASYVENGTDEQFNITMEDLLQLLSMQ